MGQFGPPPKRDAERRRRNARPGGTMTVDFAAVAGQTVEIPAPNEDDWHPIATQWYLSLAKSVQAALFEPSDWSMAYFLADTLSLELHPRPTVIGNDADGEPVIRTMRVPMPGTKLSAILKGMASLLVSEADRRRLQIETERNNGEGDENADVTDIASKRRDLMA